MTVVNIQTLAPWSSATSHVTRCPIILHNAGSPDINTHHEGFGICPHPHTRIGIARYVAIEGQTCAEDPDRCTSSPSFRLWCH